MDWILPLLAIIFVSSGTALGAYLTFNFRKQNIDNQNNIKELNAKIESIVTKSNSMLGEVDKITSETNSIASDLKTITDKTHSITEELKELTDKTTKLVDENLKLSQNSNSLIESVKDYQTGGNSFIELEPRIDFAAGYLYLGLSLNGDIPLKNLIIKITDNQGWTDRMSNFNLFNQPFNSTQGQIILNYRNTYEYNLQLSHIIPSQPFIYIMQSTEEELKNSKDLQFYMTVKYANSRISQELKIYDWANEKKIRCVTILKNAKNKIIYQRDYSPKAHMYRF